MADEFSVIYDHEGIECRVRLRASNVTEALERVESMRRTARLDEPLAEKDQLPLFGGELPIPPQKPGPFKKIYIHFESQEDMEAFSSYIGQRVTLATKVVDIIPPRFREDHKTVSTVERD